MYIQVPYSDNAIREGTGICRHLRTILDYIHKRNLQLDNLQLDTLQ